VLRLLSYMFHEWNDCRQEHLEPANHARTRMTFFLPFAAAPGACAPGVPGAAAAAALSCATRPALIVSTSVPVSIAGEYCDTRCASGGAGEGGSGTRPFGRSVTLPAGAAGLAGAGAGARAGPLPLPLSPLSFGATTSAVLASCA
jgi:hypothetical protein